MLFPSLFYKEQALIQIGEFSTLLGDDQEAYAYYTKAIKVCIQLAFEEIDSTYLALWLYWFGRYCSSFYWQL